MIGALLASLLQSKQCVWYLPNPAVQPATLENNRVVFICMQQHNFQPSADRTSKEYGVVPERA